MKKKKIIEDCKFHKERMQSLIDKLKKDLEVKDAIIHQKIERDELYKSVKEYEYKSRKAETACEEMRKSCQTLKEAEETMRKNYYAQRDDIEKLARQRQVGCEDLKLIISEWNKLKKVNILALIEESYKRLNC